MVPRHTRLPKVLKSSNNEDCMIPPKCKLTKHGIVNRNAPRFKNQHLEIQTNKRITNNQTIKKFFQVVKIGDIKEKHKSDDENISDDEITTEKLLEEVNDDVLNVSFHYIKADPDPSLNCFIAPIKNQTSNNKKRSNLNICNNIELNSKTKTSSHKLTEYFPLRRSERKTKQTVLQEKQRFIEEAIKSETEYGLEVHNFKDKGRGIVATYPFKRGDYVVEYKGDLIDISEAKRREQIYARDQNTGCYMYYFKYKNNQFCVDATAETGYLGRLVNHSRNGNLMPRTICVEGTPHLVLIAKEDINPGQELTYDYGDRSKESLKHHPWLAL